MKKEYTIANAFGEPVTTRFLDIMCQLNRGDIQYDYSELFYNTGSYWLRLTDAECVQHLNSDNISEKISDIKKYKVSCFRLLLTDNRIIIISLLPGKKWSVVVINNMLNHRDDYIIPDELIQNYIASFHLQTNPKIFNEIMQISKNKEKNIEKEIDNSLI